MSSDPQHIMKRDRIRDRIEEFFGRPRSPLPTRLAGGSARTPSPNPNPVYTRNGSSILADALDVLQADDRETISTLLRPTNAVSIEAAFNEAHNRAEELQQRCAIKRWNWKYKGRQVYLSDQAEKVVRFLDKFKAVGDVVANVDPVHVGLPWAGMRAILEVRVYR